MTDRADEIQACTRIFEECFRNGADSEYALAALRAYGDERYKQGRAVGLRDSTNYGEGRLAGLEEAARICSLQSDPYSKHNAEIIRALKEKP
jgi:hypothetical protein